jgi:glutaredoxin
VDDVRGSEDVDAACVLWACRPASRRGDDHTGHLPVTLYGAAGCHLCERARATLVEVLGEGAFGEIDITGDPELEARHREWLPVVEIGGERAFVYHVDPEALRRKVAQTPR